MFGDGDEPVGPLQTHHGYCVEPGIKGMPEGILFSIMPDQVGDNVVHRDDDRVSMGIKPKQRGHLLRGQVLQGTFAEPRFHRIGSEESFHVKTIGSKQPVSYFDGVRIDRCSEEIGYACTRQSLSDSGRVASQAELLLVSTND